jgi:hypothetical protein
MLLALRRCEQGSDFHCADPSGIGAAMAIGQCNCSCGTRQCLGQGVPAESRFRPMITPHIPLRAARCAPIDAKGHD